MRIVSLTLSLFAIAAGLSAQDGTGDLLLAPRAQRYLRLHLDSDKEKVIRYRADAIDDAFVPLGPRGTIVCNSGLSVRLADFNPVTESVTVDQKESDDTNYSSISKFVTALTGFAKDINLATPTGTSLAAPEKTPSAKPCPLQLRVTAADLVAWSETGLGRDGAAAVLTAISGKDGKLDQLRQDVRTLSEAIPALVVKGTSDDFKNCGIALDDRAALFKIATDTLETKRSLITELESLARRLATLLKDPNRWTAGRSPGSDYEVANATFAPQKQVAMTITVDRRSFSATPAGEVTTSTATTAYKMTLRQYSSLAPEVAAAVIYNTITYPKYGTGQANGLTVVKKAGQDTGKVNAALMLNGVCRCLGNEGAPIFPLVQIGVSTAKDFPGLLGGVGLRFLKPWALSLSAGRMITWYKDLDKLHVGDTVTGSADIDKDLKLKRSPGAWYLALQHSF